VPFSYDEQQRGFIDAVTTVIRDDEALGRRRDGASEQLWRKRVKLDLPACWCLLRRTGSASPPWT
jgi:hypothetical protein